MVFWAVLGTKMLLLVGIGPMLAKLDCVARSAPQISVHPTLIKWWPGLHSPCSQSCKDLNGRLEGWCKLKAVCVASRWRHIIYKQ